MKQLLRKACAVYLALFTLLLPTLDALIASRGASVIDRKHRHVILFERAQGNEDVIKPSNQDKILQEVFGIEPETEAQRRDRLRVREEEFRQRRYQRKTSILIAVLSFLIAVGNYAYLYTHPTTSLSLLDEMQRKSDALNVIGRNGKPTVVEFWAPWCENCKASARTLYSIEGEYRGRVNFVHVNANQNDDLTWAAIDRFGVDAIPHLAMVDADGYVETALIGPIPRSVLRSDLDTMIENSKMTFTNNMHSKGTLPYAMYDAFQNNPDKKIVHF